MSKSTTLVLGLCMVAFVAACAKKEEAMVPTAEPITTEPTYTGKYK